MLPRMDTRERDGGVSPAELNAMRREARARVVELAAQRRADMTRRHAAGATLEEIGALYGLTRQRVCQIIGEATR